MGREWNYEFTPQNFKNDEDLDICDSVRSEFCELADFVQKTLPEGRYKSIVKTKLEEAAMFATKSFTHQ